MALKRGTPVDQNLVEQVKLMRSMGRSQTKVAQDLSISVDTVRRYERREDETPEQSAARVKNLVMMIDQTWRIVHSGLNILEEKMNKGEKAFPNSKDLATVIGIMFDKIAAADRQLATGDSTEGEVKTTFVLQLANSESEQNPVELSQLPVEVSGDGVRIGGGENVLRLPGSGDTKSITKNLRGDSGLDLPEHEGLCPADDNGGALDFSGDTERLERELPPVQ